MTRRPTLTGLVRTTFDRQGRVTIPKSFRVLLTASGDREFVVCLDPQRCLSLRDVEEWNRYLDSLGRNSAEARRFRTYLHMHSEVTRLDPQGRVRLSDELLTQAGIDRETNATVALVGMDDQLQIWSDRRQREFAAEAGERFAEDQESSIDRTPMRFRR